MTMNQQPISLRRYEAGDFEAMFRLDEICFEPEFRFSRTSMRRFAEAKRARCLIAESAGELAGFIVLHLEPVQGWCAGYVVTLDVAPQYRRQGLAHRLMLEGEALMQAEGCSAMLLHVFTGNEGAIRFYESQGFERGHTVEAFYGDGLDALVYRKRIQPAFSGDQV